MNRLTVMLAAVLITAMACPVVFAQPAYREFQFSADYGLSVPGGDWSDTMENGSGLGVYIGVAPAPRISTGLHFSAHRYRPKQDIIPPAGANVSGHDWNRYTIGFYGEYSFRQSGLVPYVGGNLGVHLTYIRFVEALRGYNSQGDHAFGYGLVVGVKKRVGSRYGAVLRLQAENAPDLTDGFFYNTQVGVSAFF